MKTIKTKTMGIQATKYIDRKEAENLFVRNRAEEAMEFIEKIGDETLEEYIRTPFNYYLIRKTK